MSSWTTRATRWLKLWNRRRLDRRQRDRRPTYDDWCRRHDTPGDAARGALAARLARLPARPTVALVVAEGAEVRPQLYPQVTVHPPGPLPEADWVTFVDAGDVWREHALLLLVEAALAAPEAVLVYADEDRLAADGRREAPQFKCAWNPELMWSVDAVGRPALWRRAHLAARSLVACDDRHGFVLQATEGVDPRALVRVPQVLVHRRGGAADASPAAVALHLARQGIAARTEAFEGAVRVHLALPEPPPPVDIVIPTRNGLDLLRRCVDSVQRLSTYPAWRIVIVDNGSDDPACLQWLQEVQRDPRIRVRRDDRPFNYAALNNAAIRASDAPFVALLNNDIEVITPGWLEELVSLAALPQVGAVGARLWYGDGRLQHAGMVLGIGGGTGHAFRRFTRDEPGMQGRARLLQRWSAVTAACLVVRRDRYLAVGGMDEAAFAVTFNDSDLCLKLAAAGHATLCTPHAELFHHESATRGSDGSAANRPRFEQERDEFRRRWGAWIDDDPAYHPNLTREREDFSPADPPPRPPFSAPA